MSTRNQCCEGYWKVAEHHMLMSQGEDLNQFQAVKDAAKVNSPQRLYKRICATSELEAWREWQRQPKEQNGSPAHRRDGGKTRKRRGTAAGGRNSYQLNSYVTSQLELPYAKHSTAARVLKTVSVHFHSCHLMSAAIFVFWITSFFLLQIWLFWEFIYSTALIEKRVLRHIVLGRSLFKREDCRQFLVVM